MSVKVTELYTYPIKSCGGVQAEESFVTPRGLQHDRDFMLVDAKGNFVSQRAYPELAIVRPIVEEGRITVTAPQLHNSRLEIGSADYYQRAKRIKAILHGKSVTGRRVGKAADEWFSGFLGEEVNLVAISQNDRREISPRRQKNLASNQTGFADAYPILLATKPSLRALNETMTTGVSMPRFRPNVVVDSAGLAPWDEDYWRWIRMGEVEAFVPKASNRCVVPNVNQETGKIDRPVSKALGALRLGSTIDTGEEGYFFGINLNHEYKEGQTLSVGDPLAIVARSTIRNVRLRHGRGEN